MGSPHDLLPTSRGVALSNHANNFQVGTSAQSAFALVSPNAAAAWIHLGGPRTYRFRWQPAHVVGPRKMLTYVPNGPRHFAKRWEALIVQEIFAKSRLFGRLPPELLRRIVAAAR